MRRLTYLSLLAFSTAIPSTVFAGPFGLEMGMKSGQLPGKPEPIKEGFYKLPKVPEPHSRFETYLVQLAPSTGVCWIKAIGVNVRTSSYGIEIQSEFEEIRGKLNSAYGISTLSDFLLPDSIWDEPNDWMMGLIQKERVLAAQWGEEHGSDLPSDLESIALITLPAGRNEAYLALEYSGLQMSACESELEAKEDNAF